MEPINYLGLLPQNDIFSNFNQGLQSGQAIQQIRLQKQAAEQQQAAKEDLASFFSKPNKTADDYNQMMIKYPSLSEGLSASYKNVNEEKKLNDFNIASQISGALNSGNTDLAKQILTKEKEAYFNSGDTKGVSSMDNILKSIDTSPNTALEMSNMFMASIYPDKFKDTYEGIIKNQQAPLEMKKMEAEIINKMKDSGLKDAQIAKTWREYQQAPIETNIKLQNLALDKENSKIRMIEAQLRNTDNELKREELQLKIDEKNINVEKLKKETEQANNQLLADAKSSYDAIDNTKQTIKNILSSPGLDMATGATSLVSAIPGTEAKDTAALVDTLKSQAFMSEIQKMKGLGALSENEGKKVADALGSLDLGQSKTQFTKTLGTIQEILDKTKSGLDIKFKSQLGQLKNQTTGTTQQTTPQTVTPNVDDLLKKYGGK